MVQNTIAATCDPIFAPLRRAATIRVAIVGASDADWDAPVHPFAGQPAARARVLPADGARADTAAEDLPGHVLAVGCDRRARTRRASAAGLYSATDRSGRGPGVPPMPVDRSTAASALISAGRACESRAPAFSAVFRRALPAGDASRGAARL